MDCRSVSAPLGWPNASASRYTPAPSNALCGFDEHAKGRHSPRESTPGALTVHYEALCRAALGQASSAGHGMTLFVQRGMAAWLTAWTELDRRYPVFTGYHRPCAAHQQP